jgi:hypothetical protein
MEGPPYDASTLPLTHKAKFPIVPPQKSGFIPALTFKLIEGFETTSDQLLPETNEDLINI